MNAIHIVSDSPAPLAYHSRMGKNDWRLWGKRFRDRAYENGHSLETLADKLDRNASSLRHWTNGTRQINLSEFFELCDAAKVDPAMVLFGKPTLSDETMARIGDAVKDALTAEPADQPPPPVRRARIRARS